MIPTCAFLLGLTWNIFVHAQQIGHTPEVRPKFSILKCTKANGCARQNTAIVLDAGWPYRKINDTKTGESCFTATGDLNKDICPTVQECAHRCAIDGIDDYEKHGVFVKGNAMTLRQWLNVDGANLPAFPRVYLLDEKQHNYVSMQLLNQEFSFTVDVSKLPCGENGALFLAGMDPDGGRSELNPAGAAFGTGYGDAGCPASAWINGKANINKAGACAAELDIWEANSQATEMALHPCRGDGLKECSNRADECTCAGSGCGWSSYGLGAKNFYGPKKRIDTTRPFTVITQFVAGKGGSMTEVKRFYVQDNKVINNNKVHLEGKSIDSLTEEYCDAESPPFEAAGGMAQMGKALKRGMVPVFCIWNQDKGFMNWLDSPPCDETEGDPKKIVKENPETAVTFSDIRWGDLGCTYSHLKL